MSNREHWDTLWDGVSGWNKWREENPDKHPNLRDIDLAGAQLKGANLSETNLQNAYLLDANLCGARLTGANLSEANLSGAKLMNADLSGADCAGTDLSGTNFTERWDPEPLDLPVDLVTTGANLSKADFSGADLSDAELSFTNLSGANLRAADLRRSNLRRALLNRSDLSLADLRGANLCRAVLSEANLAAALLHDTNLFCAYLDQVKGLGEVAHRGPSMVNSQVLEWVRGALPDTFLRGCGLKDWEILGARLHDPDLQEKEIDEIVRQMAACRAGKQHASLPVFIAHSQKDQNFARRIRQRLEADGVRSWEDSHPQALGTYEQQIGRSPTTHGAVLLVHSILSADSSWVTWETNKVMGLKNKTEVEGAGAEPRHRLCVAALDEEWRTCRSLGFWRDSPFTVIDFSAWETDESAFEAQYLKARKQLGIFDPSELHGGTGG